MKWLVLGVVASACVSPSSVICSDGRYCPSGTTCTAHDLCVTSDQTKACAMLVEGDACMVGSLAGHCQDGACLNPVCGDGFVEIGEMCDDHNTLANDGCSADCTSTESCGNGVIDAAFGEQCDDANFLDHDGCSSRCFIETPQWIEHSLAPPPRFGAYMTYDPGRDRVILFGGGGTTLNLNDTWEFDGAEWIHMPAGIAPSTRGSGAMAFDIAHHEAVLFGGATGVSNAGDTWLWDGSSWRLPAITKSPSPRAGAAMAYDAKRKRIVLFGGQGVNAMGADVRLDETWEWDGTDWTQITPPHTPQKRRSAAMAFDPQRGVIVMTGGLDPGVGVVANTWEYDGVDWTMKSASAPALYDSSLTYDTATKRMLLFGGAPTTNALSAWNGTSWSAVTVSGTPPTARSQHGMVQTSTRMVLFGGKTAAANNETWFLSNNTWTQPTNPGPREGAGLANDPIRARLILFGGIIDHGTNTRAGDTWDRSVSGYTLRANMPPGVRSNVCLTYDYAHHNIVMFGGTMNGATPIAETWIWDGAGWMQKSPAASPSIRAFPACAYDGHHVTVVGGIGPNGVPLGDVWTWDGTTWSPAASPFTNGRGAGSAAYDPVRDRLVVFGGLDQNVVFTDETWLFDGTTWTQVAMTGFRPSGRYVSGFAWNPARKTLVLTGGFATSLETLDAYEWDGTTWRAIAASNPPPGRIEHGAASSLDGAGMFIYGGLPPLGGATAPALGDRWELRWDAPQPGDRCNTADADGDHQVGCADPDCWWTCTPSCPPAPPMTSAATCDPAGPRCGDGVCDASRETCRTCPADCTCTPVCGDGICDPGETCVGDCP